MGDEFWNKIDLIRLSYGDQPYDLSLTFSSFLSVASISFPKLSFYQTEYQNGLAPYIFLISWYQSFDSWYLVTFLSTFKLFSIYLWQVLMLKLLLNSMQVINCLLMILFHKWRGKWVLEETCYYCDERKRKRDGEKEKQRANRKEN